MALPPYHKTGFFFIGWNPNLSTVPQNQLASRHQSSSSSCVEWSLSPTPAPRHNQPKPQYQPISQRQPSAYVGWNLSPDSELQPNQSGPQYQPAPQHQPCFPSTEWGLGSTSGPQIMTSRDFYSPTTQAAPREPRSSSVQRN